MASVREAVEALLDRLAHHASVITTKARAIGCGRGAVPGSRARPWPSAVLGLKNGRSRRPATDRKEPGESKERRMNVLPVDHFSRGGLV
jgi:hypothetical protein